MRRAKDLLTRLLLTLALVVAAWPVGAAAEPCAPARCAMPCCAKRAMPSCKAASTGAVRSTRPSCDCEMRAIPSAPVAPKASPISFDLAALAPRAPSVLGTASRLWDRAGLAGLDPGPPPDPPRLHDASRAPPFVRA